MMSPITAKFRRYWSAALLCALFLLVLAVTELAIMELFSSVFARLGILPASLLDAAILCLFYAFPLWFFIFQPFFNRSREEATLSRPVLTRLFLETLFVIFWAEFLIMFFLGTLLPGLDTGVRNGLDVCLTTLIFAGFFLRVFLQPEFRSQRAALLEALTTPLKLYGLLLLVVFLADLFESLVLSFLAPESELFYREIIDPFLFTIVAAPFLWLILMRPLKRMALVEKSLCDALQAQVIDAVIATDAQGMIQSFNPAAERIFGYDSGEIIGSPMEVLLKGDQPILDGMIREAVAGRGQSHCRSTWELTGYHRDGSLIYLEVSISKVFVGDKGVFLMILRDIGTRKTMIEALRASEERFRIVAKGTNEGIWDCNLLTGSLYYTPRFAEILGFREEELHHAFTAFQSLLHREDHDRVMEDISDHLNNRVPLDSECRLMTRSGGCLWFRIRGQAVWDVSGRAVRLVGSISDISSRKEAEQALLDSALRFRQIFEQIEDAVLFLKPGTCSIIDLNPAAERLYGFSKEEMKSDGLSLFCSPEHLARLSMAISGIRHGEALALDNIINRRKGGTEIVVSIRGKVMTLQGIDIVYCSFRDVTERIRMEEEARHIQSRLIQANKMTSLGLLVSGVAHEINNPNNYILTNTQVLAKIWEDAVKLLRDCCSENDECYLGGLPFSEIVAQSPQLFADIVDGTRRINEIISNLKSFARQERTALDQMVDVNRVVATAISILHHEIVKYTKNFNLALSPEAKTVRGSSQQLGQVMINLVMNACQALPDKQRAIWVTTGFDAEAGQVTISVRDEGVGRPRDVCG
ncbi:PAS domain-containing sensor histidine kinase, partial [bacterium]|nr:PAS domain-containing sensor histidine kinase [bacterium]